MKIPTRFTQPDVLYEIGTELLTELFDRFKPDLEARKVVIPNPNFADGHYYESVAELFKSPAALPAKLVEAVLAVEELASPENKRLLEGAFWESPEDMHIQSDASPEETALQIWLNCPYPGSQAPSEAVPSLSSGAAGEASAQNEAILAGVAAEFPGPNPMEEKAAESAGGPTTAAAPLSDPPSSIIHHPTDQPRPAPQSQLLPAKRSQGGVTKAPSTHSPSYIRRRTGKVACLPKEIRDRINEMLVDGLSYAAIIKALGEDGEGLNEDNISNWKLGGFQDWLKEQKDREEMRLWEEYTLELVKQNVGPALHEATIKMATVQIRQALRAIGHRSLETALQDHPENYIRLLNSLSRLTSGAITCQNQRRKEDQREADVQRLAADPDSLCITAETLRKIEKLLRLR